MIQVPRLILASGSPRRRELLEETDWSFSVVTSNVSEPPPIGFKSPEAYVSHMAWLKASDVATQQTEITDKTRYRQTRARQAIRNRRGKNNDRTQLAADSYLRGRN